jgi:putative transcriptional regulator
MNFNSMTDEAIAAEIGQRIEQLRLERNLTQEQLAEAIGISRVSYRKLAAGEVKFINVIAALRATSRRGATKTANDQPDGLDW